MVSQVASSSQPLLIKVKRQSQKEAKPYKECHAKSHNYTQMPERICRGGVCWWAKCEKDIRVNCPAYLWVVAEFKRLKSEGRITAPVVTGAPKDERAEHREFFRELGKYVGFGDEAINCGRWGMLKECEQGHKIMKRLVCGREWCPICGKDDSEHHKRRVARLINRVFSMDSVGYFVFEVPLTLRSRFEDVGMLRDASNYISRMLRREGFSKAVRRWHFYGKARVKEVKKLELGKYHPHLNVLVDVTGQWADWDSCSDVGTGYIDKELIKRVRCLWSQWLKENCKGDKFRVAPVYYEFTDEPSKIWHWVRYITRSTFKELTDSNRHMAGDLFSFHNTSWFGVFTDADKSRGRVRFEAWLETLPKQKRHKAVDVAAHDAYETGLCPVCGAATELVEGVVRCDNYEVLVDYGGGLYHVHSPPSYADLEAVMGIGCHF